MLEKTPSSVTGSPALRTSPPGGNTPPGSTGRPTHRNPTTHQDQHATPRNPSPLAWVRMNGARTTALCSTELRLAHDFVTLACPCRDRKRRPTTPSRQRLHACTCRVWADPLSLSAARLHGSGLELQHDKGGVSSSAPGVPGYPPHGLPPTLRMPGRSPTRIDVVSVRVFCRLHLRIFYSMPTENGLFSVRLPT
jgi:hypothetical protein